MPEMLFATTFMTAPKNEIRLGAQRPLAHLERALQGTFASLSHRGASGRNQLEFGQVRQGDAISRMF
ncbi:hypothetical protein [Alkalilacustris brevis]|uniref:hypothetical protein n=1 Tax=Alkalilacustris brevis TaxID=2026338 RepID=UPI000E0CD8DD|nr:hypothetical protein [Alkalilacustris brevis]